MEELKRENLQTSIDPGFTARSTVVGQTTGSLCSEFTERQALILITGQNLLERLEIGTLLLDILIHAGNNHQQLWQVFSNID